MSTKQIFNGAIFSLVFLFSLFFISKTSAQCDVTDSYFYNPDFEEHTGCPGGLEGLNNCANWAKVTKATPD